MASPPDRPDNVRGGMLLVLAFAAIVPFNSTAAKTLGALDVPAPQIAIARFAVQALIAGTVLASMGMVPLRAPRPLWVFVLRGVLITTGSVAIFAGLSFVPLADAIAVLQAAPLIMTAGSVPFLGERVGIWRWSAVAVGFGGALLIVGPNFVSVGPAAALPAAAAVCFAGASLLTRRFAVYGTALQFQFTTALTGCALLTPLLIIGLVTGVDALAPIWPTWTQAGLLLLVGTLGMATNLMLTQAFRIAPPAALAPFLYLEIVGAGVLGFIAFGDVPGPQVIVGAAAVATAGLVVWWRDASRAASIAREEPR